jgi:hypothetical protein
MWRQAAERNAAEQRRVATAHADAEAVAEYVAQVGPPFHALYDSWKRYLDGISSEVAYESFVTDAYHKALELRPLLEASSPPRHARLFHARASEMVRNVVTVVELRNRIVQLNIRSSTRRVFGEPSVLDESEADTLEDRAGTAFYAIKTSMDETLAMLASLETRSTSQ